MAYVYHTTDVNNVLYLMQKLPVSHLYGDARAVLNDGNILKGIDEHDNYCSREIRNACNTRTTLFDTQVLSYGGYGRIRKVSVKPHRVLMALSSVTDWSIPNEFLNDKPAEFSLQLYDNQYFHVPRFMQQVFRDFSVAFYALQDLTPANQRLWIKIAPLAMGPTIGQVFHLAYPWYSEAVKLVFQKFVNESWVHTIELIDFHNIYGHLGTIKNVNIIVPSNRDALDFSGCPENVLPASILPMDSFCAPWLRGRVTAYESLATCALNNTSVVDGPLHWTFKKVQ